MAYEVILNRSPVYRILLEQYMDGVYIDVFDSADSKNSVRDYFQPDFLIALKQCESEYGLTALSFSYVPDEHIHGDYDGIAESST